jgi:hypothetical protein
MSCLEEIRSAAGFSAILEERIVGAAAQATTASPATHLLHVSISCRQTPSKARVGTNLASASILGEQRGLRESRLCIARLDHRACRLGGNVRFSKDESVERNTRSGECECDGKKREKTALHPAEGSMNEPVMIWRTACGCGADLTSSGVCTRPLTSRTNITMGRS